MQAKRLTVAAVLLSITVLGPSHASAASGTFEVVTREREAKAVPGWPKGVLKLINDPLRTSGWYSWFSECANDGYYYGMDVRRPEDVNRLIKILAAIEAKTIELRLDPAEGAPHANGVGAIFALGNQSIVNRWFLTLREVKPGIRQFGVHEYRKPPTAQPPTLTLYVGHRAIDLKKLTIPANVEVTAPNAKSYRKKHKDAFIAIDEFIEGHKAR